MRAILAWLLLASAVPAAAQSSVSAARDAQSVIDRMIARNPSLLSFQTRVHVDLHMLNFPYLAQTLEGTLYFKRPDKYEVVFDSVPAYMSGFSRLLDNIGDPDAWQRDQNIFLIGTRTIGGKPLLWLRLTAKIHDDNLDHADAYIDPRSYELVRMEWHYTNGGTIVMTQSYRSEFGFVLLAAQHATVDIPRVRAVGDATYGAYQTNIDVDDHVFTEQ